MSDMEIYKQTIVKRALIFVLTLFSSFHKLKSL